MIQRSPTLRFLLAMCALSSLQGCSVLFIDRVPKDHARIPDYTCTSNRPVAGIDALVAAYLGTMSVAMFVVASEGFEEDVFMPLAIGTAVPALVAGGSSAHGFIAASECESAMDERDLDFRRAYALDLERAQSQTAVQFCGHDAQCPGAQLCIVQRCVDRPPPHNETPQDEAP